MSAAITAQISNGRAEEKAALVALQNADCTTVGRELDLREAAADRSEQTFCESGRNVAHAMRVGLQISLGLVVNGPCGGLRVQIEGVVPGEAHLHSAFPALHCINAGADEIAIKKDIACGGEEADIG